MTIFNQIGHLAHQVNRSALGLHLAVGCNSERLNCRVSIVRAAAVTAIILAGQPVLAESGPDAMRALIGNTLVGKLPDKKTFYIYFRADGMMMTFGEGLEKASPVTGAIKAASFALAAGGRTPRNATASTSWARTARSLA